MYAVIASLVGPKAASEASCSVLSRSNSQVRRMLLAQFGDEEMARRGRDGLQLVDGGDLVRDRPGKTGTVEHEGVELAVLAARVDPGGQVGDEAGVELPGAERAVEEAG